VSCEVGARAGWARRFTRFTEGTRAAPGSGRSKREELSLRDLVIVVVCTLATLELSRTLWDSAAGDVGGYYRSALAFWAGHPALRTLPVEYPPGAVAPFALTLAPIGDPALAFLLGAAVAFVLGYLLSARASGRRAANRYALYGLLGAQGTLLDRYDLFPALLTLGALWFAQRRRFIPAYVLLAGGVALKLYPAVLIPAVAIAQWRAIGASSAVSSAAKRLGRVAGGLAICGALIGVSTALPMLRSAGGLSALRYALDRPVQVESLQGTLVWLGTLCGLPARMVWNFGSQNFVGALAMALPGPAGTVMVAGCGWVYLRLWRGTMAVSWAFLALLCVVVVTSKVFSAQYVVWLLPIAAETGGYEALWIASAALTSLDYPMLFPFSQGIPPLGDVWPYLLTVALRNALLAGLTALLLVRRGSAVSAQHEGIAWEGVQAHRAGERPRRFGAGVGLDVAGQEGGPGGGERGEDDGGDDAAADCAEQPRMRRVAGG
jgi:hypothetical protein